jgi:hypothetical protein
MQQHGDTPFLTLITLSSPDLASNIYLVNNREEIISNGVTYQPYAFTAALPSDEEGKVTSVQLVIDNVDRQIVEAARTTNAPVNVSLSVVLADDPDTVEVGPYDFVLRSVSYNQETVSGQLVYQERLERQYPQHRMTARLVPGLFA